MNGWLIVAWIVTSLILAAVWTWWAMRGRPYPRYPWQRPK